MAAGDVEKYIIVKGEHELDLERKVDKLIQSSAYPSRWEPQGGVVVVEDKGNVHRFSFYQAMVKLGV